MSSQTGAHSVIPDPAGAHTGLVSHMLDPGSRTARSAGEASGSEDSGSVGGGNGGGSDSGGVACEAGASKEEDPEPPSEFAALFKLRKLKHLSMSCGDESQTVAFTQSLIEQVGVAWDRQVSGLDIAHEMWMLYIPSPTCLFRI